MSQATTFVGMDVHQRSIDLTLAEGGHDGAITHFASIGGDLDSLDRAVTTLRQRPTELYFVYEAGPNAAGEPPAQDARGEQANSSRSAPTAWLGTLLRFIELDRAR